MAIRAAQNGGPENADILKAIVAAHTDTIECYDRNHAGIKVLQGEVAQLRDEIPVDCEEKHKELMKAEIDRIKLAATGDPRRETDPPAAHHEDDRRVQLAEVADEQRDEEGTEMRIVYRLSKWAVRGIVGALIVLLVGLAFNFYVNRSTARNEIRVDKGDLHALIIMLQKEHATPLPTPARTP